MKVCRVRKRNSEEARARVASSGVPSSSLPVHFVEITASFYVPDSWVCGVAPLGKGGGSVVEDGEELLVMLTVPKQGEEELGKGVSPRPQVQVVEPAEDEEYNEISTGTYKENTVE